MKEPKNKYEKVVIRMEADQKRRLKAKLALLGVTLSAWFREEADKKINS